jgi:hypothetical protein
MALEDQLAQIKDKAELRAWIDELPDGVKGLILLEMPDDPNDDRTTYRYREIGDITIAEGLYAVKSYEHFLFDRLSDR